MLDPVTSRDIMGLILARSIADRYELGKLIIHKLSKGSLPPMRLFNRCLRHTWVSPDGKPIVDTGMTMERSVKIFNSSHGLSVNVAICYDCGLRKVFAQSYWGSNRKNPTPLSSREQAISEYEEWRSTIQALTAHYSNDVWPGYSNNPDITGEYFRPIVEREVKILFPLLPKLFEH